jgi:hypothetical protein
MLIELSRTYSSHAAKTRGATMVIIRRGTGDGRPMLMMAGEVKTSRGKKREKQKQKEKG